MQHHRHEAWASRKGFDGYGLHIAADAYLNGFILTGSGCQVLELDGSLSLEADGCRGFGREKQPS
jgi:hypothetical protein